MPFSLLVCGFCLIAVVIFFEPHRYDIDIDTSCDSKSHNVYWLHCRRTYKYVRTFMLRYGIRYLRGWFITYTNERGTYIQTAYLQHCIKCNVNIVEPWILYHLPQRVHTHTLSSSRNVIIILSFWFQVVSIWTCSAFVRARVCIQSFNMIISISWYCGGEHTLAHMHAHTHGGWWCMRMDYDMAYANIDKNPKIDTAHW